MTMPPQFGGGGYVQTMGLCKHLRETGEFDIRVAYPDPGHLEAGTTVFAKRGQRSFRHDVEGFSYYAIRSAFPAIEFRRYAHNQIWDELLTWADSAQVVGGGIAQGFPAARSRTPYALWVASTREADGAEFYRKSGFLRKRWLEFQFHFIRKLERETLKSASRVFVISEYTRKLLENTYDIKIDYRNFIAVPVDVDFFRPDPAVNKQRNTICYAGRINDPRKQVHLLLSSLRRVREKGIDVFLKLAGETPGALLLELVRKLELEQSVDFVGHIPSSELPHFYQSALFSVLPSQEEGQGIAVLEAMSCGLPVVATRCGGPESLIEDGHDGFLVANGQDQELAERMEMLIRQPDVALGMGQRAREKVLHTFTPAKAYTRILEFHLAVSRTNKSLKTAALAPCKVESLPAGPSTVRQDFP